MSSSVTPTRTVRKTEYAKRIFLSRSDKLDETLRDTDASPVVVSSYNFPSLLNLPMHMSQNGPLRHLWEGGPKGEAFLRRVKPLITQGFRPKWADNLLTKLHKIIAFFTSALANRKEEENYAGIHQHLHSNSTSLHKYDSQLEVLNI